MSKILFQSASTAVQLEQAMLEAEKVTVKRGHLGFSSIADPDLRTTWLKFRWSLPDEFPARNLRIFRLGHLIEDEVIALLRSIPGFIWEDRDDSGKQFNFSYCGGHVGGSMDGRAYGVPEAPKTWHVGEVKSAKDDQFKALIKAGSYKKWSPTYFGQIQCYMGAAGYTRGLVVVYNKDTSELYFERIHYVPGFFENAMITASSLLEFDQHPSSIYTATDYRIKNYKTEKYQRVYWGTELPKPNCRNCNHAQIMMDGDARWHCNRWQKDITAQEQRAGCDLHLFMPAFMPATMLEDHGTVIRYKTKDGIEIWNSEDKPATPGQHIYDSKQLHGMTEMADLDGKILNHPDVLKLRAVLDGEFKSEEEAAA